MSSHGWIRLTRNWREDELFRKEIFTEHEAWIWLLAQAAFKDHPITSGPRTIFLKRGQCSFAIRFLATKWQWDKGRVERFLKKLVKAHYIKTQIETGQTLITICNYETLQHPLAGDDTRYETRSRLRQETSVTKKKKANKAKKDNIPIPIDYDVQTTKALKSVLERMYESCIFDAWLKNIYYVDGQILCQSVQKRDWVRNYYGSTIKGILDSMGKPLNDFRIYN